MPLCPPSWRDRLGRERGSYTVSICPPFSLLDNFKKPPKSRKPSRDTGTGWRGNWNIPGAVAQCAEDPARTGSKQQGALSRTSHAPHSPRSSWARAADGKPFRVVKQSGSQAWCSMSICRSIADDGVQGQWRCLYIYISTSARCCTPMTAMMAVAMLTADRPSLIGLLPAADNDRQQINGPPNKRRYVAKRASMGIKPTAAATISRWRFLASLFVAWPWHRGGKTTGTHREIR